MRRSPLLLSVAVLIAACSVKPALTAPPVATAGPVASALPTLPVPAGPTASPADTTAWVTISPDGQGFTVLMPGEAAKTTSNVQTPVGEVPITIWTYTDASEQAFTAMRMQFPKKSFSGPGTDGKPAPVSAVLDGVAAQAQQMIEGGSMTGQSDVQVSGHAGRRFLITGTKVAAEGVFVVAGDDLYFAYLSYPRNEPDAGTVAALLASFALSV